MMVGNFQCRGILLIWIIVGQGPPRLTVGVAGGVWTFFSGLSSPFFLIFAERWLELG